MVRRPLQGGLIRELLVNAAVLAVGLWAATVLLARFFLGNPHLGPIPLVPFLFSPLEAFAFPILGAVMGFALAQGSAVHRSSVNYILGQVYDRLASSALDKYAAHLSPEFMAFMQRIADYLDENQRGRTMSAEARRAIVQVATELRGVARQLEAAQPELSARYTELANSVSTVVHTRRLRAEVETDQPGEPLYAGREYKLHLKFEAEQGESSLPAYFGNRTNLRLALHLFGRNLIVRGDSALHVSLPTCGDSTQAVAVIEVPEPGPFELRVIVTTTAELEILQTYNIRFKAVGAPEAPAMG